MQRINAEQTMRGHFNAVSANVFKELDHPAVWYSRPIFKNSHRILLRKCDIYWKFRFLCRRRKSRSHTKYSISSGFREKQRHLQFVVISQVAQAGNMSIGDHRHCCVTFKYKDLSRKKTYLFCNLRKWKDFNKKQLTLLKMSVTSLLCGPRAD